MINSIDNNSSVSQNNTVVRAQSAGASFSDALDTAQGGQTDLDQIFERAAQKYNVPVNLLKAIAKVESGFNPNAVSYAGACGIMQLMPATASYLGVTDSFDPEQSIMGGAKYMSQMLDMYNGDTTLALAAYNAGCGNVNKYGGVPPFAETQTYVKKVQEYANGGDLSTPNTTYSYAGSSSAAVDVSASTGTSRGTPIVMSKGTSSGLEVALLTAIFEKMTKKDDDEDHKII